MPLKPGRPCKKIKVLATDKAYDCKKQRTALRKRGIRLQVSRQVWKTKKIEVDQLKCPHLGINKNIALFCFNVNTVAYLFFGNVKNYVSTH